MPTEKVPGTFLLVGAACAALWAYAWTIPVGTFNDDALAILLARSLAGGAFVDPASGDPVTDPLPGFAAFLLVPVRLVAPHWKLLAVFGTLSAAALAFGAAALARRVLGAGAAVAAAAFVGLNPSLVLQSGSVLSELPYAALSAGLVLGEGRVRLPWLAAGTACAAMLRPQGAPLAAALALSIAVREGWRRGTAFGAAALAPLALWTLRNRFAGGESSGYAENWLRQVSERGDLANQAQHLLTVLRQLLGAGLGGVGPDRPELQLAVGAALLALGVRGAAGLVRDSKERWPFTAAVYLTALGALHATWLSVPARYAIALAPFAWPFVLAGARPLLAGRPAAAAILAGAFAAHLAAAAAFETTRMVERPPKSATLAWLAAHTGPEDWCETARSAPALLLAGRRCIEPADGFLHRDEWLADRLRKRIRVVWTEPNLVPSGYYTRSMVAQMWATEAWARSTPYAREVYLDPVEKTALFRLEHPDPARFERAWRAFHQGRIAVWRGNKTLARKEFQEAVRLEPTLALAWASLAMLEPDLKKAVALLERAVVADPTSEPMRADLATRRSELAREGSRGR